MPRIPVTVIFDVGKTNKKLIVFDNEYRIALERTIQLPEIKDEDGDPCEDIQALTRWIKESFLELLQRKDLDIKHVNCSAYGASFVHVDDSGQPVAPLYNYLKAYPKGLQAELFGKYGGTEEVARATASPILGHLNSGMQLYWLKKNKPELFGKIKYSLHLPQYISFLFTGKYFSDLTSIGCHTALWNFDTSSYHNWVSEEGIAEKLAPVEDSGKVIATKINGHGFNAGIGLHDSSSALIPYLQNFKNEFALLSTGTWCITLNPFNHNPVTPYELAGDCLCYLSYQGKPVKASRLFGGNFHEQQTRILADHFNVSEDYYRVAAAMSDWKSMHRKYPLRKISKPFTPFDPSAFSHYDEAYVNLMEELIERQLLSSKLVLTPGTKQLFVDGGFGQNPLYMNLLAEALPSTAVYASTLSQASALGAAMAIRGVPADLMSLKKYGYSYSKS